MLDDNFTFQRCRGVWNWLSATESNVFHDDDTNAIIVAFYGFETRFNKLLHNTNSNGFGCSISKRFIIFVSSHLEWPAFGRPNVDDYYYIVLDHHLALVVAFIWAQLAFSVKSSRSDSDQYWKELQLLFYCRHELCDSFWWLGQYKSQFRKPKWFSRNWLLGPPGSTIINGRFVLITPQKTKHKGGKK